MFAFAACFQVRVEGVWHVWKGVRISRRSPARLYAKMGLGRLRAVFLFVVMGRAVLWMAAGLFACAAGFQVRVEGVWHVWEGVCIARRSVAHLHAKKDKGRWEFVVSSFGRCGGRVLCLAAGMFACAAGFQVRVEGVWPV